MKDNLYEQVGIMYNINIENINEIKEELLKKYKELRDVIRYAYKFKQAYKIDVKNNLVYLQIIKDFSHKKDEINSDILDLQLLLNINKIMNNNEKGDEKWQVDHQN